MCSKPGNCSQEKRAALIPALQAVQDKLGFVPRGEIERIAHECASTPGEVHSVLTFYSQFRLRPPGKHQVKICSGTACHVNGCSALTDAASDALGISPGQTDLEGLFSLETVNCVGCCSLAPVLIVDGDVKGGQTPRQLRRLLASLKKGGGK